MRKLILAGFLLAGCGTTHRAVKTPAVSSLQFVQKYIVPHNMPFNGTTVGGLSGIDYDSAGKVFYLICDDRSERQPARFYTAKVPVTGNAADSVIFTDVTSLRMPDGNVYPKIKTQAPDPEAMRYNPHSGTLIWSGEGERIVNKKDTILNDPNITEINKDGRFAGSFPVPSFFHMKATENGPRRNGGFEGLGLTPDGRYLFVSLEEPRYEDGPRAGLTDTTAYVRILKYDLHTRQAIAQYAYKLDPVAHPAVPAGEFLINGISDILVLSETQLLVMERSFSTGVKDCTIRVYITDLSPASNVSRYSSLQATKKFTPAQKKLLFNFETLHTYIDNIEGVTFGPRFPDGSRSLIFVADNNFEKKEETQFYIFKIQ
ncbi:esterase-like activity of phytase family protein [Chitinophaga tropicalis]|uniref:Esterase-like activity of phytase family protein n=1 Tax=Chitinophaga tropicalis TaxID=2683588 RepID=A0A7K1TY48_9BACT|nr:esterase-like activity of phytase family protein [Chitinophaga tropicalis]MVT07031.1 esterase-like activity of phytase family protein [Chitinophaga tropicalis]